MLFCQEFLINLFGIGAYTNAMYLPVNFGLMHQRHSLVDLCINVHLISFLDLCTNAKQYSNQSHVLYFDTS